MIQKKRLIMAMQQAKQKRLRIKQCSDSLLWYANLVGQTVPLIREIEEGYLSYEPSGYTNIVLRCDAEIEEEVHAS